MSPTGTGEGSQVFYMMLGLNTVLVKNNAVGGGLHYWNGISRLNNHTLNLMTLDNQRKLGLPWVYQINLRHMGLRKGELWVNAISRFYEWRNK
jgi:hypothetical protein